MTAEAGLPERLRYPRSAHFWHMIANVRGYRCAACRDAITGNHHARSSGVDRICPSSCRSSVADPKQMWQRALAPVFRHRKLKAFPFSTMVVS
jgi:hypothetical protein